MKKKKKSYRAECLENRLCLTGYGLAPEFLVPPSSGELVAVLDVDEDGLQDIVASNGDLNWHRNIDAGGRFAEREILFNGDPFEQVESADVDGDGRFDLVGRSGNTLLWMQNLDRTARFSRPQLIGQVTDIPTGDHLLIVDDIDNDSDQDLLFAFRDGSQIYAFLNDDNAFTRLPILSINGLRDMAIGDIDTDGRIDLVVSSDQGTQWFRQATTIDSLISQDIIAGPSKEVAVVDIDGDLRNDVLVNDGVIRVFRNEGPAVSFGHSQSVFAEGSIESMRTSDLNGDGLVDLVGTVVILGGGFPSAYVWSFINTNGSEFRGTQLAGLDLAMYGNRPRFAIADIQNDGTQDVVIEIDERISVFFAGSGDEHLINSPLRIEPWQNVSIDMDSDGDLDLVTVDREHSNASIDGIVYYRLDVWWRRNEAGEFSDAMLLGRATGEMISPVHRLQLVDLDRNGQIDIQVITGTKDLNRVSNTTTIHSFMNRQMTPDVATLAVTYNSVRFYDHDGDDFLDLFAYDAENHNVIWQRNRADGSWEAQQRFFEHTVVGNNANGFINGLIVADLNLDGRTDLILQRSIGTFVQLVYSSELNGFITAQTAVDPRGEALIFDADDDGDFDIATVSSEGHFRYFEMTDFGTFALRTSINLSISTPTLQLADLDQDLDMDIIVGGKTWIEESTAGRFVQSPHSFSVKGFVTAGDFDGDADTDLFDGGALWEARPAGDANGDGRFDSSDLVTVFQANEYEDDVVGNSTFQEGDWNNDGDFDSADLIFAFQCGTYEAAARPHRSAARVATFVDRLFALNADEDARKKKR